MIYKPIRVCALLISLLILEEDASCVNLQNTGILTLDSVQHALKAVYMI